MTVPAGSNIYSNIWGMLHSVISGNTIDPLNRGRKLIVAGFPDTEGANFPGYPIIVVDPITTDRSRLNIGTSSQSVMVRGDVWVYSASNQQMDQLSDDVNDAICSNRSVLAGSGLFNVSVLDGGINTDIIAGSRIHSRLLNIQMNLVVQ